VTERLYSTDEEKEAEGGLDMLLQQQWVAQGRAERSESPHRPLWYSPADQQSETSSSQHFLHLVLPVLTRSSSLQRPPSPRRRPSSVVPRTTCKSVSLVCPTSERVLFSTSPLVVVRPVLPVLPVCRMLILFALCRPRKGRQLPLVRLT
jgi:hypothetical protein